jgi:hypothetical protein
MLAPPMIARVEALSATCLKQGRAHAYKTLRLFAYANGLAARSRAREGRPSSPGVEISENDRLSLSPPS